MIPSFSIDHTKLEKGVYVSRVDEIGDKYVTTYDIRVCRPYRDRPIPGRILHTVEHIGADILRNGRWGDKVVYFGPMGCRTGFYLILKGLPCLNNLVIELMRDVFEQVSTWDKPLPGMLPKECGNATYHDLEGARVFVKDFLNSEWKTEYPK